MAEAHEKRARQTQYIHMNGISMKIAIKSAVVVVVAVVVAAVAVVIVASKAVLTFDSNVFYRLCTRLRLWATTSTKASSRFASSQGLFVSYLLDSRRSQSGPKQLS